MPSVGCIEFLGLGSRIMTCVPGSAQQLMSLDRRARSHGCPMSVHGLYTQRQWGSSNSVDLSSYPFELLLYGSGDDSQCFASTPHVGLAYTPSFNMDGDRSRVTGVHLPYQINCGQLNVVQKSLSGCNPNPINLTWVLMLHGYA